MAAAFERKSIGVSAALKIVEAATAKGSELGGAFAVAVVDESGVLKAFARMDGSQLQAVQLAQDKAYSAAGTGVPTGAWPEIVKNSAELRIGLPPAVDRLVMVGGGVPLTVDGALVGGLGVSGGMPDEDVAVAEAGLAGLE